MLYMDINYKHKTPFLRNSVILSDKDHPGKLAVVLFVNTLICNMNCIFCHNKNDTIYRLKNGDNEVLKTLTIGELMKELEFYEMFDFELVIICGGEPTVNRKFIKFIEKHRKLIEHPIRIDTNGQHIDNIKFLKQYAEGFAINIKVDIDRNYSKKEIEYIEKSLGIRSFNIYKENLKKAIDLCYNMPYTIIIPPPDNFMEDINNKINIAQQLINN